MYRNRIKITQFTHLPTPPPTLERDGTRLHGLVLVLEDLVVGLWVTLSIIRGRVTECVTRLPPMKKRPSYPHGRLHSMRAVLSCG